MSRSIFAESSGSYSGDILELAKNGIEELMPFKAISRNDLRQGYYIVKKATVEHNITSTFGNYSNEIGRSSIFFKELAYKMHVFDTVQRISLKDLMYENMTEDEVKANLELGLMKDAYHSIIFGKPNIKMEGIANLTGRSKITTQSLTTGFSLYKMHVFDTVQRISLKDLMRGTITEDEVKANLELGLMKDAYYSVIFGKKTLIWKVSQI